METKLKIDLIEKFKDNEELKQSIADMKLELKHQKYSVGDVIEFVGGMNRNIIFTTEITGFDVDGNIYVLWDSFWFPIRDEEIRQIKIIKKKL